jgi:hypothetical protein
MPTLVRVVALLKFLAHMATTGAFGYGYFVDELYFQACSDHLAWGFVDMPPLTAALAALVRATLGESLLALRLLPALAGAGLVLLTARLAKALGGGPFAQLLAAVAVLVAPIFLVMHSFHSMNAFEPLYWTGCAYVLVRIIDGAGPRYWLLFGLLAGVGLLNKHTMALFGFAVLVGLLATSLRRQLTQRWIWLGGLTAAVLFSPNLLWMVSHGFPHFQMLANIRESGRNVSVSSMEFLLQQGIMLHPLTLPIWLGGLLFCLCTRSAARYRVIGLVYLAVLALLLLMRGRVYYMAPAYPMLLALGGVAIERWLAGRWATFLRTAYVVFLLVGGLITAPLALPCLPPGSYVQYTQKLGLSPPPIETHRLGPLPQLLADRFGWPEMAQTVADVYHSLPPEERTRAAIFGQNYGQAGAIDLFGPALGLPKAISGHLAYHDWGPREYTGEIVIVMDDTQEQLERWFEQVERAGRVSHPYSMPYQHFDIFICRRLRRPLAEVWPQLRELG